eukprot:12422349-Karenia_brevis.AAC.1
MLGMKRGGEQGIWWGKNVCIQEEQVAVTQAEILGRKGVKERRRQVKDEEKDAKRRNEVREQESKRLKTSQESEEDKALQEDVFGPEEIENKRPEEPENKRRRTQEELDWHDDFWA